MSAQAAAPIVFSFLLFLMALLLGTATAPGAVCLTRTARCPAKPVAALALCRVSGMQRLASIRLVVVVVHTLDGSRAAREAVVGLACAAGGACTRARRVRSGEEATLPMQA